MNAAPLFSRRQMLAGAAAGLAAGIARPARAAAVPRVATVDWAILETLLAIGVTPVAASELVLYRQVAVEPELPSSVADLGLRGTPNFEALRLLSPDLIFSSNFMAWAEPKLRLIAPVENLSIYSRGGRPYAAAEEVARTLGERTGRVVEAEAMIAGVSADIARLKMRLAGGDGLPMLVINLGDARHFRVFGTDSMFGETLTRLGLGNAWTAPTRYSATAPIGLETLAQIGPAWIVVLAPVPADARRMLAESAFWHALPNVQAGRLVMLAGMDPFGGLPAAHRFGRLLTDALPYATPAPTRAGSLG